MDQPSFVDQTVIFLGAGLVGLAAARFVRLNPIVGFFFAGAMMGPFGFDVLKESGTSHMLAELGVAFLLLDIGLHLSPRRLLSSKDSRFSLGLTQVVLTTILAIGFARLCGLDLIASIVIGSGLSLSSTAIVLKSLKDRHELAQYMGRTCVGILVFQDIYVLLVLILLPSVNSDGGAINEIGLGLGQAIVALLGVWGLGRYVMRPLFQWLGNHDSEEAITLATLFFVFCVVWGASAFGLPLALGAFLAGVALSESSVAARIQHEIKPFRSVFLSLFFVAVGMSLDLRVLIEKPFLVVGLTFSLLAIKGLVIVFVARLFNESQVLAQRLAFTLCQGSEFAFILFALAGSLGVIDAAIESLMVAVVGISLAIAPYLIRLGARLDPTLRESRVVEGGRLEVSGEADDKGSKPVAGRGNARKSDSHPVGP